MKKVVAMKKDNEDEVKLEQKKFVPCTMRFNFPIILLIKVCGVWRFNRA